MQTHHQTSQSLNALLAPFSKQFQNGLLRQGTSSVPLLTTMSQYYMLQPSKRLRPCLILLMCQATNGLGSDWETKSTSLWVGCSAETDALENILPEQLSLAQVFEILHVASLLHDDVIDNAETRRGSPSVPALFGNRRAILAGDFLLGRAMRLVGTLGSPEVMSLVAEVFCTLVEGELLQAGYTDLSLGSAVVDPVHLPRVAQDPAEDEIITSLWQEYLQKTYMKTASLFAKAMECAVILGGATAEDPLREAASSFGACLGMAFQIVDDLLDFEGDPKKLGKPANADMRLGLVTAPVFFALQEDESIRPRVLRCFEGPGDVEATADCVRNTQALSRTRKLAESYAMKAREALNIVPDSAAKEALLKVTFAILARQA
ncbi:terpenoid synthase [Dichomitus squalens]|uniref:(2E,6E)-farnesyl diphosphate synthase n=1 Tax=Dichomitus squalens TaxID=114155 RepID=A0A4Q9MVL3_9APHY|nr:terpenoid synthase [Dichomitus squalens]